MTVSAIKSREAILKAIEEFDRLGRDAFLEHYHFGKADRYFLDYDGELYDSKAIIGAAHGYEFPALGPLQWNDFTGGEATVQKKLEELGFKVQVTTQKPGRVFGAIPGYSEGTSFASRTELSTSGVHKPLQAGISGSEKEGADSIVLSGGYEDDEDFDSVIVYTGQGGRDQSSGKQNADQPLSRGNLALTKNQLDGLPVRVIRGSHHKSPYSPTSGYRYDGLYRVEDYWHDKGRSEFYVWRFRLVKIVEELPQPVEPIVQPELPLPIPQRKEVTTLRVVRDSKNARKVKEMYGYCCQVCGTKLETPSGPYAEAAHIKPLGRPHDGPDIIENILCLCPNHHALFDLHGFAIADDYSLIGISDSLTVHSDHHIRADFIRYHREHYPVAVQ